MNKKIDKKVENMKDKIEKRLLSDKALREISTISARAIIDTFKELSIDNYFLLIEVVASIILRYEELVKEEKSKKK